MTTSSSSFDTALAVYTGTSISNLVVAASDDDSEKNRTSICRFQVIAGQPYYIAVDVHAGATGEFTLTIAQSGAPSLIHGGIDNGALSFSLFSDGATQVELQRSTNLLDWEGVRTISSPERLLHIAEPASATSPHMFYRVVQP